MVSGGVDIMGERNVVEAGNADVVGDRDAGVGEHAQQPSAIMSLAQKMASNGTVPAISRPRRLGAAGFGEIARDDRLGSRSPVRRCERRR